MFESLMDLARSLGYESQSDGLDSLAGMETASDIYVKEKHRIISSELYLLIMWLWLEHKIWIYVAPVAAEDGTYEFDFHFLTDKHTEEWELPDVYHDSPITAMVAGLSEALKRIKQ